MQKSTIFKYETRDGLNNFPISQGQETTELCFKPPFILVAFLLYCTASHIGFFNKNIIWFLERNSNTKA